MSGGHLYHSTYDVWYQYIMVNKWKGLILFIISDLKELYFLSIKCKAMSTEEYRGA